MTTSQQQQLIGEASTLLRDEKNDQALEILEALSEAYPEDPSVITSKAYCLGKLGRLDEAFGLCDQLGRIDDGGREAEVRGFLNRRRLGSASGFARDGFVKQAFMKDSGPASGNRLNTMRANLAKEFKEIRSREREATSRIEMLKRNLEDREEALSSAITRNAEFEHILTELRDEIRQSGLGEDGDPTILRWPGVGSEPSPETHGSSALAWSADVSDSSSDDRIQDLERNFLELTGDVRRLREREGKLSQSVVELETKLRRAREERSAAEDEAHRAQGIAERWEDEALRFEATLEENTKQLNELRGLAEQLGGEREEYRNRYAQGLATVEELNQAVTNAEIARADANRRVEEFEGRLLESTSGIDRLERELRQTQETAEAKSEERSAVEIDLEGVRAALATAQQDAAAEQANASRLAESLSERDERIAGLESNTTSLQGALDEALHGQARELEQREALERELAVSRGDTNEARAVAQERDQRVEQLEAELVDTREARQALDQRESSARARIQSLSEDLSHRDSRYAEARDARDLVHTELSGAQDALAQSESRCQAQAVELELFGERLESARAELQVALRERAEIEERLNAFSSRVEQSEARAEGHENDALRLTGELVEAGNRVKQLEHEAAERVAAFDLSRAHFDERSHERDVLQTRVERLVDEVSALGRRVGMAESERDRLHGEVEDERGLRAALAEEKAEIAGKFEGLSREHEMALSRLEEATEDRRLAIESERALDERVQGLLRERDQLDGLVKGLSLEVDTLRQTDTNRVASLAALETALENERGELAAAVRERSALETESTRLASEREIFEARNREARDRLEIATRKLAESEELGARLAVDLGNATRALETTESKYTASRDESELAVRSLSAELAERRREMGEAREDRDIAQRALAKFREAQQPLEDAKDEIDRRNRALMDELAERNGRLIALEKDNESLREHADRLDEFYVGVAVEFRHLRETLRDRTAELESTEDRRAESEAQRVTFFDQLEYIREEHDRVIDLNRRLSTEVSESQLRADTLSREKSSLEIERNTFKAEAEALRIQQGSEASRMESAILETRESRRKLEDATMEKSRLKGDVASLEVDFDRVRAAYDRAAGELESLRSDGQLLRTASEKLRASKQLLESDVARATEELGELRSKQLEGQNEIERLSGELNHATGRATELESTREQLAASVDDLELKSGEQASAIASLASAKESLEALLAEREAANERRAGREGDTQSVIAELEAQVDAQAQQLSSLTDENVVLTDDRTRLNAELQGHRATETESRERIEDLTRQLEQREASLAKLEEEKETIERQASAMTDELDELRRTSEQSAERVRVLESELVEREAELVRADQARRRGAAEISNIHARMSELESAEGSARQQLGVVNDEMRARATALETLEREKADLEQTVTELSDESSGARNRAHHADEERERLEAETAARSAQLDEALSDKTRLAARLEGLERQHEQVSDGKSTAEMQVERLTSELATARGEVVQTAERSDAVSSNLMQIRLELDNLRSKSSEVTLEKRHLERRLEAQQHLIESTGEDRDRIAEEAAELQGRIEGLLNEEAAAKREVEAIRKELAGRTDELSVAREEAGELSVALDELRAAHEALSAKEAEATRTCEYLRGELEERNAQKALATADRTTVGVRIQELTDELAALREAGTESDEVIRELRDRAENSAMRLDAVGRERDEFESTVERLGEQLARANEAAAAAAESSATMAKSLLQGETAEQDAREREEGLRRELDEAQAKLELTISELMEARQAQEAYDTAAQTTGEWTAQDDEVLGALHETLESMRSDLGAALGREEAATAQLGELSSELAMRTNALNAAEDERARVQSELIEVRATSERFDAEHGDAEARVVAVVAELDAARGELERVVLENTELDLALEESRHALAALEEGARTAQAREGELEERLGELDARLALVTAERDGHAQRVRELEEAIASAEATTAAKGDDFESVTLHEDSTSESIRSATARIEDLTALLQQREEELQASSERNVRLKERVEGLQGENVGGDGSSSNSGALDRATAELATAQRNAARLSKELEMIRAKELPEALEQKVRAFRETRDLRAEIEMLRNQLW